MGFQHRELYLEWRQNGRVEGCELTPLTKTLKSQLTAEQPSTKKNAGTYQKIYPTSKDKEDTTTRWGQKAEARSTTLQPA